MPAHQAPPPLGFSRQEYWSGLPFPSPLLSSRRKQTINVRFFSPSLYKFKKRFLLKFCVAMMTPGSTWTFLKPWLNQGVFLWKCWLCLQVSSSKTQNLLDKPVCFTHTNVLFSYVNETVFAWKPAFFQDSCQSFYGPGQLTCANVILNCMLWMRGLVLVSEFETFPFSN